MIASMHSAFRSLSDKVISNLSLKPAEKILKVFFRKICSLFSKLQNVLLVFSFSRSSACVFERGIGEIRKVGQVKVGQKFPNFTSFPSCLSFRPGLLKSMM